MGDNSSSKQPGIDNGEISMPRPLASIKSTNRYSMMSGSDFLPTDLLSRSCSAPPTSEALSNDPTATRIAEALRLLEEVEIGEHDEIDPDRDPRLDPNYPAFFHNYSRLDPRLPPPIYRPGQSWQQQTSSSWSNGNSAPRLTSRFVQLVSTEEPVKEDKKKMVDRIQEESARSPSPIFAPSRMLADPSKNFIPIARSDPVITQSYPMYNYNSEYGTEMIDNRPTPSPHAVIMLEELRKRRVELNEVLGFILEFSMDQHGSRFIQQKLETANEVEKNVLFSELLPSALMLMTDVFGNYVIQKFFEFGSDVHRSALADLMVGHVLVFSLQMYGCRVVQKALEHVPLENQKRLVKELDGHVLRCVRDQNGNHVIQKCIEVVDPASMPFLVDSFKGQVYSLATHPYGCRVIQRMFENGRSDVLGVLLTELHQYTVALVQDQYGNYVVQHILEQGSSSDRRLIFNKVLSHFVEFSCHKFASNVVEKCVVFGDDAARQAMIDKLMEQAKQPDGTEEIGLLIMMRDQYANYVIQKMVDVVQGDQKEQLLNRIKPHAPALRKYTYGKHILAKLDKLGLASPLLTSPLPSAPRWSTKQGLSVNDPRQFPPLGQK